MISVFYLCMSLGILVLQANIYNQNNMSMQQTVFLSIENEQLTPESVTSRDITIPAPVGAPGNSSLSNQFVFKPSVQLALSKMKTMIQVTVIGMHNPAACMETCQKSILPRSLSSDFEVCNRVFSQNSLFLRSWIFDYVLIVTVFRIFQYSWYI